MSITYTAGFDSPSAQNGSLNPVNVNSTETINITFDSDPSIDDYVLSNEGGAVDPNTSVIIDSGFGPETYSFSVVIVGRFPGQPDNANKVPDPLEEQVVVIIRIEDYDSDGDGIGDGPMQFYFTPDYIAGTPEADLIGDVGNKAIPLDPYVGVLPPLCFMSGTTVETLGGKAVVDDLHSGDLVLTKDAGAQPISWVSSSLHAWPGSDENHKPILIQQGALGADLPTSDLAVSPQHHIVMKGPICANLFGADEVLAPAKGLTGLAGVRIMAGKKEAEYFHIMMPQHEILIAHGVETESFYPGTTSLQMMTAGQRASLLAVVPTLRDDPERGYGPTARKKITRRQAEQLVEAMKNAAKSTEAVAG